MLAVRGVTVPEPELEAVIRRGAIANAGTSSTASAILGAIVSVIILAGAFILIRKLWNRRQRGKYYHANDSRIQERVVEHGHQPPSLAQPHTEQTVQTEQTEHVGRVDRNLSVRSVMTLPAYRKSVGYGERVLGREGERDGIDVVVEMPTVEKDEALRDEEMEALYQIRLARRRHIEEQEERLARRREARERNDDVALRELRQRMRQAAAANPAEIEQLRIEHQQLREFRQRAVSSVQYADVGIARADGTRVRANSLESERQGLLSDAASMALSHNSTMRHAHALAHAHAHAHTRDQSLSSAASVASGGRPDSRLSSPALFRSRASSFSVVGSPWPTPRAGSNPDMGHCEEVDLGDAVMPPGYDTANLEDGRRRTATRASAYPGPPPGYPGPGPAAARQKRLSVQVENLVAETTRDDGPRRSSGAPKVPRLPKLQRLSTFRLDSVPKIVIQPSSARPGGDDEG